jgi:2-haloacid dehalogenase
VTGATGWLTFDCYGTLVDWRSGMEEALRSVAPDHVAELLTAYHRFEPSFQTAQPFPSYRTVLTEGLRAAAEATSVSLSESQLSVLADSMPQWPVFPETARVLQELRDQGWGLGILSNVDDEVIAATLPQLQAPIDVVITSAQVRSYKPALPHFRAFEASVGAPAPWLHVACSWFHDVVPAHTMQVPAIFINRENEVSDTDVVEATLPDLTGLPEAVAQYVRRTSS